MKEICEICSKHDALIVENTVEFFGAISFNGNKIITDSSDDMFLTNLKEYVDKVNKW